MSTDHKPTEIGLLPMNWECCILGSHATFRTGPFGSALHKSDYTFEGVPIVNPMHIVDGRLTPTATMTVTESAARALADFRLRENDIVIGRRGDMGRCAVVTASQAGWVCGTGSMIVRCGDGFVPDFLQRVLSSDRAVTDIENASVGSTMTNLNQGVLARLRVQKPPKEEQRAITTALSDMDDLLVALNRLIAKKRDLKQAAMQQLLTGQTRLPGFRGKWVPQRLGQLATITRGASPRPIDSPIWFDDSSKVGWVRISDVTRSGIFLRETEQRLSPLGIRHSRPVTRGSLIMSICATVGRPVITDIDSCIHDGFVVFDALRADQKFLYYALKAIEGSWRSYGQTGSQMNLNTGLIKSTEILVAETREEQSAIATALSDVDAELSLLEQRRDKTRHIRQGMMQELLTGRTRLL